MKYHSFPVTFQAMVNVNPISSPLRHDVVFCLSIFIIFLLFHFHTNISGRTASLFYSTGHRIPIYYNTRSETGTARGKNQRIRVQKNFLLTGAITISRQRQKKNFTQEEASRKNRFQKIQWLWHLHGMKVASITTKDLNFWPSSSM